MDRISKIKEMLQSQPNDSFLLHALGLEYLKLGEEAQAKDTFINLLIHNPNYVGTYYHLANLLVKLGENEDAVHYFEKGMEVAKMMKDQHSYNELQSAYEEWLY